MYMLFSFVNKYLYKVTCLIVANVQISNSVWMQIESDPIQLSRSGFD